MSSPPQTVRAPEPAPPRRGNTRAAGDLLLIAAGTGFAFGFASALDAFEMLAEHSRGYERWQLDEIFVALTLLAFGLGIFSYRRWRELHVSHAEWRAAEALLVTGQRVEHLLDHSPAILYSFRLTGERRVGYVSGNVTARTGYEPREFTDDPTFWAERLHPDDAPRVLAGLERLFERGSHVEEYRFLHRSGEYRWMRDEVRLVRGEDGAPATMVGSWIDITARRQAEDALQQSEHRFRDLVETAGDIIYRCDAQGFFTYTNPASARILGYETDDIVGRHYTELMRPEFHEAAAELYGRQFRERLPMTYFEFAAVARDGSDAWVGQNVQLVWEGDRIAGLQAVARDIGARKAAEAALLHSEERYRGLVETAGDLIYRTDGYGRFTYVNPAMVRVLGYPEEELLGASYLDFLRPNARAEAAEFYQRQVLMRTHSTEYEIPVVTRDGRELWLGQQVQLLPDGDRVPRLQAVARDVSERKRAEDALQRAHEGLERRVSERTAELQAANEALRASEERFRALTENAQDVITVLEADGTIRYQSPSLDRVLGYRPERSVGDNVLAFVHPDDLEGARAAFEEAIRRPGEARVVEFRYRHRDGSWRMLETTITSLVDNPSIGGIVVNSRDVTERKVLEEQFRQAQKMEAVGRLAGGVAHDFNNVLTAIRGNAELLLMDLGADPQVRDDLEEINRAVSRAAELTHQLLAFSRQQILQPRVLDLNTVVAGTERMLRRLIGEDVEMLSVLDPALGRVRADPGQVEQVIVNLVVNARDAMPRGGRLTLETTNVRLDEARASRFTHYVRAGPYVVLSVRDTGSGMDPDTASRIFEPFFTTKEVGRGTGLGLATVYGIVEQSGGFIEVDSEVRRGSCFRIHLPRVDAPAEPSAAEASRGGPGGSETVLVVEDEEVVRSIVRRVLKNKGYTVLEAPCGEEALRIAGDHPGPIPLMITDMVMPGIGGRELATRLSPLRPELGVLYTSGYTDDPVLRRGAVEAGSAFLAKPFTPEELATRVRELLDGPRQA